MRHYIPAGIDIPPVMTMAQCAVAVFVMIMLVKLSAAGDDFCQSNAPSSVCCDPETGECHDARSLRENRWLRKLAEIVKRIETEQRTRYPFQHIIETLLSFSASGYKIIFVVILCGIAFAMLRHQEGLSYQVEYPNQENERPRAPKLYITKALGECMICLQRFKIVYAFLPCGHTGVCCACSAKIKKCCVCNAQIDSHLAINL